MSFFESIAESFTKTFITDERLLQLLSGLGVTMMITVVAAIIGIVFGFLIAIVRATTICSFREKVAGSPRTVY